MAFNDEQLARAIADCPVPIVSAVGHEIDFTIADFVADVRAPTPSVAAEVVVPDGGDWLRLLDTLATRIIRLGRRSLEELGQSLDWLSRRLVQTSPSASLERSAERLQNLQYRLSASAQRSLERTTGRVHDLQLRLSNSAQRSLAEVSHRLQLAARGLHSVSPLATLERGYAIVEDAESGKVLLRSTDVSAGDDIRARLSDGELIATVKKE
jgi:exodeoxyribonuclease VII large subunit